jgi:hypothetical protein
MHAIKLVAARARIYWSEALKHTLKRLKIAQKRLFEACAWLKRLLEAKFN